MSSCEVSVVIPTRDRWPLLSRALASVFAQRGVAYEVVVVDDGSSDRTPVELARVAGERTHVIRFDPSRGVAQARNRAIAESAGEWIAFLDDDDLWAPDKLRRQLEHGLDPGVALVYSGAAVIDEEGFLKRWNRVAADEELSSRLLLSNVIGSPSGVVVRADAVRAAGGFDEQLAVLADWDLWLRLFEQGRVRGVDAYLYAYTEHSANMHVSSLGRIRAERRHMERKHRVLCDRQGVRLGGLDFSRWLVGQYRSHGLRLDASREYARIGVRHRKPRDLARAAGLLMGEGVMKLGPRQRPDPVVEVDRTPPDWLRAGLQGRV